MFDDSAVEKVKISIYRKNGEITEYWDIAQPSLLTTEFRRGYHQCIADLVELKNKSKSNADFSKRLIDYFELKPVGKNANELG